VEDLLRNIRTERDIQELFVVTSNYYIEILI